MLRPAVGAVFKSLDQPREIALELGGTLKGRQKGAILNRAGLGLPCLMAMDVARDELAKQLADRRLAGSVLDTCQVASSSWTRAMWSRR